MAHDGKSAGKSSLRRYSQWVVTCLVLTIGISDLGMVSGNAHSPEFLSLTSSIRVKEDVPVNSSIFICSARDPDPGSAGQLQFAIVGGSGKDVFKADSSCNVTLSQTLNFEDVSGYDVILEVRDLDPISPMSSTATFTVQVVDVNEKPRMLNLPGPPIEVLENDTPGQPLFTCSAEDPDSPDLARGQLTYTIVGGNNQGLFSLDADTCELRLSGILDYESRASHELSIQARDLDPEQKRSVARPLVVNVIDINEHAPELSMPNSTVRLGETARLGLQVISCTAKDADSAKQPSGQLHIQITRGNEAGHFAVPDPSKCRVTLAKALDFEVEPMYRLVLEARDQDPIEAFTATAHFDVIVFDENDKPVLQEEASPISVAENTPQGEPVFDCTATDQDDPSLPAGQVNYAIIGGNTNGAFFLAEPCRVVTKGPLDTERQAVYLLQIRARDSHPYTPLTDRRVYNISITDINDNTPNFVGVPPMPMSLPEDTQPDQPFMQCSARDKDTPLSLSSHIKFELVAGNEEDYFSLEETSCNITLLKELDYDDVNLTRSFNLTLRVTDLDPIAPRSSQIQFRFCVTNVNDNAPKWVETPPSRVTVKENAALGSFLGTCNATDADAPLHPSSHVRYYIKNGNTLGLFYMDSYTCDLFVHGLLDYESKKRHTLTVVATDLDPDKRKTRTSKVKVFIEDENDVGPTCVASKLVMEVPEDTRANKELLDLTEFCSDLDSGKGGVLRFKFKSASNAFKVSQKGSVKLRKRQDYEASESSGLHELEVEVSDNGTPANQASLSLLFIVTDVDDNKPLFASDTTDSYSVSARASGGTLLLNVSATDADSSLDRADQVTYALLEGPDHPWLWMHPYTGQLGVKRPLSSLPLPVPGTVDVELIAFSDQSSRPRDKTDVTLFITDVNITRPVFNQSLYQVSVKENSSYPTPLLSVEASHPSGSVRYSISEGPLTMSEQSGEIRLVNALDFEQSPLHSVTVTAWHPDTHSLTATASVLLHVTPVNEHSPVLQAPLQVTVAENLLPGTVVFELSASDQDAGQDGELVFSAPPQSSPWLVSDKGLVTLAGPLNQETESRYEVPVTVTDLAWPISARRNATDTLVITVVDASYQGPNCTAPPLTTLVYPWVGPLLTVKCYESSDRRNGELRFIALHGDLENVFQLSSSGEVAVLKQPSSPRYELSVEVSDGGQPAITTRVPFSVFVQLALTVTPEMHVLHVPEDTLPGSLLIMLNACCSFSPLQWTASPGVAVIDAGRGELRLGSWLDREETDQHLVTVKVRGEGGQTATSSLTIQVGDVNDNPPSFRTYALTTRVHVSESLSPGLRVAILLTSDTDLGENGTIHYSLSDPDTPFTVDQSGHLKLRTALDYHQQDYYTFHVLATDNGTVPLTATSTIQIQVFEWDRDPPEFVNGSNQRLNVSEDFTPGEVLMQLEARDAAGGNVTYRFRKPLQQDPPLFALFPDTGELYLTHFLDREEKESHVLEVQAEDRHGNKALMTLQIIVQDVDDNAPHFSQRVFHFAVDHDTNPRKLVDFLTVSDPDEGENAAYSLSITSGNDAGYFTLSGIRVNTVKKIRYEDVSEFMLMVRAEATNLPDEMYDEAVLHITVLAPASVQPRFPLPELTVTVPEDLAVGSEVCDAEATALGAKEGGNSTLRYTFLNSSSPGLFTVQPITGVVLLAQVLDFENSTQHTLTLQASSSTGVSSSDTLRVIVNVRNVNENPPTPLAVLYEASLPENTSLHTTVVTVEFTDDDDVSFSLSKCDSFAIDQQSGAVTVIRSLDYLQAKNYFCVVTATDSGSPVLSAVSWVVINVTDVNNHPPRFTGAPFTLTIQEDTSAGKSLITFTASDLDSVNLTYSLTSLELQSVFSIDASTGDLFLNDSVDATLTPVFNLTVHVSDDGSPPLQSEAVLIVKVVDVNDHSPVFTVDSVELVVSRTADLNTQLVTVTASDGDLELNADVTYAFEAGNEAGLVSMDPVTGRVSTSAPLLQAPDFLLLNLTATDRGSPPRSASIPVNITVTPPRATPTATPSATSVVTLGVREDATMGTLVGVVDAYPLTNVTECRLLAGNFKATFSVKAVLGQARVMLDKPLDREEVPAFYLTVKLTTESNESVLKFVMVEVEDVNDNPPQLAGDGVLRLSVMEHSPPGLTLTSLTLQDRDLPASNGPLVFDVTPADLAALVNVSQRGELVLRSSPKYSPQNQVTGIVTVKDGDVPALSSSVSVELTVVDVEERQEVHVTPPSTVFLSMETADDSKQGQVVHQLTPSDFNLTAPPGASVTFIWLQAGGPLSVDSEGRIQVTAPDLLRPGGAHWLWVVCRVHRGSAAVLRSQLAVVRVDAFVKNRHLLALHLAEGQILSEDRTALLAKLQSQFTSDQRVGIYTVIDYGESARRRLLATRLVVLLYVVSDVSVDLVNNVPATKVFLTHQQMLQALQESTDGTPVQALTRGPMTVDLVTPYQAGIGQEEEGEGGSGDGLSLALILGLAAVLFLALFVLVVCLVCCCKHSQKWKIQQSVRKGKPNNRFITPAPAFFKHESQLLDDVSEHSLTSLGDDDSGLGDSSGSLATKSPSPSSGSDESPFKQGQESATKAARFNRPFFFKQARSTQAVQQEGQETLDLADSPPSVSWLPDRRGSEPILDLYQQSPKGLPKYGRRGSEPILDPSQQSSKGLPKYGRRGSGNVEDYTPQTQLSADWASVDSLIAEAQQRQNYRDLGRSNRSPGYLTAWAEAPSKPEHRPKIITKDVTPGRDVVWKPKRNEPVKIFSEKLVWKAVSSIPKAAPLPRRDRRVHDSQVSGTNDD